MSSSRHRSSHSRSNGSSSRSRHGKSNGRGITLSRMSITGPVDEKTPLSVLLEISDAHGISVHGTPHDGRFRDNLIRNIGSTNVLQISYPYQRSDYSAMARFVNKNCRWNPDDLIEAFEWILSFRSLRSNSHRRNVYMLRRDLRSEGLEYEELTPHNVHGMNACLLYACCRYCNIPVPLESSPDEMAHYLGIFLNGNIERGIGRLLSNGSFHSQDLMNTYIDLYRLRNGTAPSHDSPDHDQSDSSDDDLDDNDRFRNLPRSADSNIQAPDLKSDASNSSPVDNAISSREVNNSNSSNQRSVRFRDESSTQNSTQTLQPPVQTLQPSELPLSPGLGSSHQNLDQGSRTGNPTSRSDFQQNQHTYEDLFSVIMSVGSGSSSYSSGPAIPRDIDQIINRPRLDPILSSPPRQDISYQIDCDNKSEHTHNGLDAAGKKIQEWFRTGRYRNRKLSLDTISEVLAAAAIIHQIDISSAEDPVAELHQLRDELSDYIPLDLALKQRLDSKYPEMDSPRLNICFNPQLPRSLYTNSILRGHALEEGFTTADMNETDPYELLQVSHFEPTFHLGKLPGVTNERTAITFDEISDLEEIELVSYGCRESDMRAFTYQELYETFRRYRVFQNPASDEGEYFSDRSISRLILLASQIPGADGVSRDPVQNRIFESSGSQIQQVDESEEVYMDRTNLVDLCNEIKRSLGDLDEEVRNFIFSYEQSNKAQRKQIDEMMWSFHSMAMNMRGWNGKGPYPIVHAPVNNQNNVDSRVLESICDLEDRVSKLGRIGSRFLELPLVKYNRGIYIKPRDRQDGVNLGQRLAIVKGGDNHNRIASCIRLTSNWFCSSIYRYMKLLRIDPQFEIKDLRSIG